MGKIINGIKYIVLSEGNGLKIQSFEDNVYFTLRDIYLNADAYNTCMLSNYYSNQLDGGIEFSDRTIHFQYNHILNEKTYIRELSYWMNSLTQEFFEFTDRDETAYHEENKGKYMRFDEWWQQFEYLRKMVNKCVSNLALENTRSLWIPRDCEIQHTHHL